MHYGTFVTRRLRGLGLAAGDRIALISENRWECMEVMITAAKVVLVFVPLDSRLADAAHLLKHSGPPSCPARTGSSQSGWPRRVHRPSSGAHLDGMPDSGQLSPGS
jgi:long-subunit acyl-CoA synthetase (AMP-forming)